MNAITKFVTSVKNRPKKPLKMPNAALTTLFTVLQVIVWIGVGGFFIIKSSIYDPLGMEWFAGTFTKLGQFLIWLGWTIAFIVYWIYRSAKHTRIRNALRAQFYNSLIRKHIDEVLALMPPPTKSVKHRGSSFISYYWTKTSRSGSGFSIPISGGIRMFAGGSSSTKETFTLLVDPETSLVYDWNYSET